MLPRCFAKQFVHILNVEIIFIAAMIPRNSVQIEGHTNYVENVANLWICTALSEGQDNHLCNVAHVF
jgi:hypothetical protein